MSIRTRSSTRRSDNSTLGEEEYQVFDPPPRRQPPPPPPPLPPVVETTRLQHPQQQAEEIHNVMTQTDAPQPWKLKVRTEPTRSNHKRRDVIHILITPAMMPQTLSECILQTCGMDHDFRDWVVAGLFRESDCLFVSLQDVIDQRDSKSVFSLTFPHWLFVKKDKSWLTDTVMIVLAVLVLLILWLFGSTAFSYLSRMIASVFELCINLPIRELYRYGPSFIGWEGASLPTICARITYIGDESYWRQNYDQCQQLFQAKEEAMLRTVRPLLYFTTSIIGFWVARILVREHALSLRQKDPDRDMLETYHAFNVLLRQVSRAMGGDRRDHHHQAR